MEAELGVVGEAFDNIEEDLAFFGLDYELPSVALRGVLVEGRGGLGNRKIGTGKLF